MVRSSTSVRVRSTCEDSTGLRNANPQVRLLTAKDVERQGPRAAPLAPILVEALRDPDWDVRLAVVDALKSIGAAAVPFVTEIREAGTDKSLMISNTVEAAVASIQKAAAVAPPVVSFAVGNTLTSGLTKCASIADSLARLVCYDTLAKR